MNNIKNDEPHNSYKKLKEDQPAAEAMAFAGPTTTFTNPMPGAYPNPNAMAYPNPNAMAYPNPNAMAHPNPNAMAYPNPTAMAYPNPTAMAYPNPTAMAYPNPTAMAYPNSNATAQPDPNAQSNSKYAMTFPNGATLFSTAPDQPPVMDNEVPKFSDVRDFEEVQVQGFDFSEELIRKMFIRKVYAVLMCQLLLTVAITAFFMYCQPIRNVLLDDRNVSIVMITMITLSFAMIIMMLCTELRRVAPWNFIFLGVFTATQGVVVGILGVYVKSSEILLAFGITAAVVFALTLFAFQTKWDFTTIGGGLLACLVVLIIFGLLASFVPQYRTMRLLYSGAGVVLFSFYIIYDTQLMIGGEHKYSISPEEYIFAALTLYLDILNLFIYILRMMRS